MGYKELIKEGYEGRIQDFRFYLQNKCIDMGMSVMPHDVAEVMEKADQSGKYKYLLFNGFVNVYGKYLMLIDVYEGLGFQFPEEEKELNLGNLQTYF